MIMYFFKKINRKNHNEFEKFEKFSMGPADRLFLRESDADSRHMVDFYDIIMYNYLDTDLLGDVRVWKKEFRRRASVRAIFL